MCRNLNNLSISMEPLLLSCWKVNSNIMRQCQRAVPISSFFASGYWPCLSLKNNNNDCAASCLYYCSYQVCTVSNITVWKKVSETQRKSALSQQACHEDHCDLLQFIHLEHNEWFSRLKTLHIFNKQGLQNGLLKPIRRWLREKSTSGNGDGNLFFSVTGWTVHLNYNRCFILKAIGSFLWKCWALSTWAHCFNRTLTIEQINVVNTEAGPLKDWI